MLSERRKHRRIGFERPVSVTTVHGNRWSGLSKDFSMEGIRIHANWQAQVGDEFRVVFSLAPQGAVHMKTVLTHARVKYCDKTDNGFSMGIQFLH